MKPFKATEEYIKRCTDGGTIHNWKFPEDCFERLKTENDVINMPMTCVNCDCTEFFPCKISMMTSNKIVGGGAGGSFK